MARVARDHAREENVKHAKWVRRAGFLALALVPYVALPGADWPIRATMGAMLGVGCYLVSLGTVYTEKP